MDKNSKKLFFCLLISFLCISGIEAQEKVSENEHHNTRHAVAIVLSHSNVSKGIQNGKTKWQSFPSWGINYNYSINQKWLIGWHNDIIVEDFVVHNSNSSDEDQDVLERSYPIATLAVVTFKPLKYLGILLGAGGEFAHQGNFAMVRLGLEAPYHLPKKLEAFVSLTYDYKINAYNTWNIGFGFAKLF